MTAAGAGVCTGLVHFTGHVMWDSIGSICVGCLMGATAWFLISRNRQMLIGAHKSGALLLPLLPRTSCGYRAHGHFCWACRLVDLYRFWNFEQAWLRLQGVPWSSQTWTQSSSTCRRTLS